MFLKQSLEITHWNHHDIDHKSLQKHFLHQKYDSASLNRVHYKACYEQL